MQDAAESRRTFLVALNFASVYTLWGSTYLAIRFGVQDLPPALLAGTRFLIAGALLFSWLLVRRVPLPPRSLLLPIAITGMLLLFGGNYLVTWAELTVPSGLAAVIVANLPFFVAAIEAGRKDGERLSGTGVLGLVIGFAGMLVLMWPKLASTGHHGLGDFRGEFALLAANLCWAYGSVYARRHIRGIAPLMGVALEMLIAGAALTLAGLLLGEAPITISRPAPRWRWDGSSSPAPCAATPPTSGCCTTCRPPRYPRTPTSTRSSPSSSAGFCSTSRSTGGWPPAPESSSGGSRW